MPQNIRAGKNKFSTIWKTKPHGGFHIQKIMAIFESGDHWVNSSSINLLFLKSDIALKCIENLKQWYSHYFVFLILKNQFLKNLLLCSITEMVQANSMTWDDTNFKDFFHENWFNVTISRNFNLLKNFREIVHRDLHSTKCSSEIFFKKNKNHYPYLLLMVCSLFFQVWPKETWLPI